MAKSFDDSEKRQAELATAVLTAARDGLIESVRSLLDRGTPLNAPDRAGRTAVTWAAANRQLAVVTLLLDRGAIIDAPARVQFDGWLSWLDEQSEQAYEKMCDATNNTAATGHYSNAKEFLHDAIALARRLKRQETEAQLMTRLDHIKTIFRSQFPA
jgi:ankyrin repeat protein